MKNYIKNLLVSFGIIMIIVFVNSIVKLLGMDSDSFYNFCLGIFIYLWVRENKYF